MTLPFRNSPFRRLSPVDNSASTSTNEFALIGAGYWAAYQLAAWREVPGARCVAVVDVELQKAQQLCHAAGVERCYADTNTMLLECRPSFVDIVTDVHSHVGVIETAANHQVDVICQKPLAPSLAAAREVTQRCDESGVMLLVHENWRWQRPIRQLKAILDSNQIGRIFRARLNYNNSFPVFDNQPSLKNLDDFILCDMGTHLFDVLRFLFGEPRRLFCEINRSRSDIRGEDVASVLYRTTDDISVICSMSYASRLELDRFPETLILVEGQTGSVELTHDYWISVTTCDGTLRRRYPPTHYEWVDSRYALVQSSMVDCHRHLLNCLVRREAAETSAADNLKTLAIVDAAYRSARTHQVIDFELEAHENPRD